MLLTLLWQANWKTRTACNSDLKITLLKIVENDQKLDDFVGRDVLKISSKIWNPLRFRKQFWWKVFDWKGRNFNNFWFIKLIKDLCF